MSHFTYSDNTHPLALLFPGQGSQYVGMGLDLARAYSVAQETMQEADDVLDMRLSALCFQGPAPDLTHTVNAQPALLATSIAALRALAFELGDLPRPQIFAGHSMGEYTALVAANSISFADGLRLVRERGRLMARAGDRSPGRMAAVLGLDLEQVTEVCMQVSQESGGLVQVANDNCPGQIVISGNEVGMEAAMAELQEAGARRVVPLDVSIAAHSPLMQPAAAELSSAIRATRIQRSIAPLVANTSADLISQPTPIARELEKQLTGSILWSDSMRRAVDDGVQVFVEIGPGDVLTGLMKRIDRKRDRLNVSDPAGVEEFRRRVEAGFEIAS